MITVWMAVTSCTGADDEFSWRKVDNAAFEVGEYLLFTLRWGLIHGGYSTMAVDRIEKINGRDAYVIISKARTNSFFDAFFKVRDVNTSWLDTESLCSHRFYKDISEGKYKRKRKMDYDQVAGILKVYKKNGIHEMEIPPFVLDVLGAMYYIRAQTFDVGDEFSIEVNTGKKNWPLIVKVLRRQRVKVPYGVFDCLVVVPQLLGEGIFETKGNITVWMTDDERHMPVKMKTKVQVGSLTADLIDTKKREKIEAGFDED